MRKVIILFILALLIIQPVLTQAVGINHRFTGQELDTSSGLYNYGQRYYQPNVGRFTQPDSVFKNLHDPQKLKQQTGQNLEQILSNPQAFNEYSYTVNNPVRYVDPRGEWFKEFFTGQQSWSSFESELGEASMYVNPVMETAIDHPYITGAVVGVVSGAILAVTTLLTGGSITCGILCGSTATTVTTAGFSVAQQYDRLNKAARGAYELTKSNQGYYKMIDNAKRFQMTVNQVKSSMQSNIQNAFKHLNYIKDPSTYPKYETEFKYYSDADKLNTLNNWYKQATQFIEQANTWKGHLGELIKK